MAGGGPGSWTDGEEVGRCRDGWRDVGMGGGMLERRDAGGERDARKDGERYRTSRQAEMETQREV